MTAKALAAPLLLALALSACSSAPQHPAPQLPDTWFSAAGAHPADAESLASWWRQFDDPQLTDTNLGPDDIKSTQENGHGWKPVSRG